MHVLQVVHAHHGTSALAGAGVDALSHLLVDDASQVTGLIAEPARGEARACGAECPEARARAAESVLSDRLFRPPRFAG